MITVYYDLLINYWLILSLIVRNMCIYSVTFISQGLEGLLCWVWCLKGQNNIFISSCEDCRGWQCEPWALMLGEIIKTCNLEILSQVYPETLGGKGISTALKCFWIEPINIPGKIFFQFTVNGDEWGLVLKQPLADLFFWPTYLLMCCLLWCWHGPVFYTYNQLHIQ